MAVIGLGRFGGALALELQARGTEVLGVDVDDAVVSRFAGDLTHVIRADTTEEAVLRQLGIPEFDRVVLAVGSHLEASILTASLLLRVGIEHIWAKATSDAHGAILKQLGVNHVVYPEQDMGKRVAHLVRGTLADYIDVGDDVALVVTTPPPPIVDRTIAESRSPGNAAVEIVARKAAGGTWRRASEGETILPDDLLLVLGASAEAENFGQR